MLLPTESNGPPTKNLTSSLKHFQMPGSLKNKIIETDLIFQKILLYIFIFHHSVTFRSMKPLTR
jgi:hypothetical protein